VRRHTATHGSASQSSALARPAHTRTRTHVHTHSHEHTYTHIHTHTHTQCSALARPAQAAQAMPESETRPRYGAADTRRGPTDNQPMVGPTRAMEIDTWINLSQMVVQALSSLWCRLYRRAGSIQPMVGPTRAPAGPTHGPAARAGFEHGPAACSVRAALQHAHTPRYGLS
jgi:hypothetical protein